jgi:mRNA-degrading endonuclease RelE of RelBE toxin-antitoxin system
MTWTVNFTARAAKQKAKLPARIAERLDVLRAEIEQKGPIQLKMAHFGKLKGKTGEVFHCHLNKGRPTYVAVWKVEDRTILLVEVTYVGTHENAPY